MFAGFPADGLALLSELPAMDRPRFRAAGDRYAAGLQAPLRAFVQVLGVTLLDEVSPGLTHSAKTHGSISPINNDVRFNPNAATYKDHVLLRFWEGADKKTAPTLFVRLTATEVGFASGAVFYDLARWREAVSAHGDALALALGGLVTATGAGVVGEDLKRVPLGFPRDHPHASLLRHKWIQARWARPLPASVGTRDFVGFCAGELARAGDVHRWLVRHLLE
jgi:uncharacterized protein (DUF2461 family)